MKRSNSVPTCDTRRQTDFSKKPSHFTTSSRNDHYDTIQALLNDSSDESENENPSHDKKSFMYETIEKNTRDKAVPTRAHLVRPKQTSFTFESSLQLDTKKCDITKASKRKVLLESDSENDNDSYEKQFQSGQKGALHYKQDEENLKHNEFSSFSMRLFDCDDEKNSKTAAHNQDTQCDDNSLYGKFQLRDFSSSSSSSSCFSSESTQSQIDLKSKEKQPCNTKSLQPNASEYIHKNSDSTNNDISAPIAFPVESIQIGLHGISAQSPSFNKRSRNWFQKLNSPKNKSPKVPKEIKKKPLKQSKISFPIDYKKQNLCQKNMKRCLSNQENIAVEVVEIDSEDDNEDHHTYQKVDFHNSKSKSISPLHCISNTSYHDANNEISYDAKEDGDEIISFCSRGDDDDSRDENYQYEPEEENYNECNLEPSQPERIAKKSNKNNVTYSLIDDDDDDDVCVITAPMQSDLQNTRSQNRNKRARKVSCSNSSASKTEFIRVGGKHSDIWMKSSSDMSSKSVRRTYPLRNDLSGGSGVGMGGFMLMGNNDTDAEKNISQESTVTSKKVPSRRRSAPTREKTGRSTSKKAYSTKRRYKRKRWGGASSKKKSYTRKKGKSTNAKKEWSRREQGYGSGRKGEYMQISRQDPQLGNDGGANITF